MARRPAWWNSARGDAGEPPEDNPHPFHFALAPPDAARWAEEYEGDSAFRPFNRRTNDVFAHRYAMWGAARRALHHLFPPTEMDPATNSALSNYYRHSSDELPETHAPNLPEDMLTAVGEEMMREQYARALSSDWGTRLPAWRGMRRPDMAGDAERETALNAMLSSHPALVDEAQTRRMWGEPQQTVMNDMANRVTELSLQSLAARELAAQPPDTLPGHVWPVVPLINRYRRMLNRPVYERRPSGRKRAPRPALPSYSEDNPYPKHPRREPPPRGGGHGIAV